jgi:FkbM family methyltransferase
MATLVGKLRIALGHPDRAAVFSYYAAQRLMGRDPAVTDYGGEIRGFRRFNDYWSARGGGVSAAEIAMIRGHHGEQLFDVGANFGAFSLAMGRENPKSAVHSFEPSPRIFGALRENIRHNRMDHVRANQMAVSDTVGTLQFTVDEQCGAMSRLGGNVINRSAPTSTLNVQSTTLDHYCQENKIDRIALLKIDVEGAEPKVLRGAAKLLSQRRIDFIYLEYCPQWLSDIGESTQSLRDSLEPAGYRFHQLSPDGTAGELLDLKSIEACANIVAVAG